MRRVGLPMLLAAMVLSSGCTTRLMDFTLISSKNIELSRFDSFHIGKTRARGRDVAHIIIFIPTGMPNPKEALDRAIESIPGAVALLDGVILQSFWYIPYIYGQQKFIVEGTPLIDPKLASASMEGNYFVTHLDKDGKVRETKRVSRAEYAALKKNIFGERSPAD